MTSSKQVNIRKNLIQSITNIPCDDFGQTTDLGVFSAYLYTPESCDGLQRHDHVMLPKGVLITVETPVSKRVSLNHPYRFNTITLILGVYCFFYEQTYHFSIFFQYIPISLNPDTSSPYHPTLPPLYNCVHYTMRKTY